MPTDHVVNSHLTLDQLAASQIVLVGAGREGLSSYHWLRQHFPTKELWWFDEAPLEKLGAELAQVVAADPQLTFTVEPTQVPINQPPQLVLIKTPGIPVTHLAVQAWLQAGAVLTSNTQLFFDFCPTDPRLLTIGVTGTKGKSTTTSAIHHVLAHQGWPAILAGNIGRPPLTALPELAQHLNQATPEQKVVAVLELSAHQLAEIATSPDIAVILDVVPEHLDYYVDFATYLEAKRGLVRWQNRQQAVIYDPESDTARQLAQTSPGQHWQICAHGHNQAAVLAWLDGSQIWYQGQLVIAQTELAVKGQHNAFNLLPSVVIGRQLGLKVEDIATALRTFRPLPHRLELVATHDGIDFYDDSLATVPEATLQALAAFADRPIILLAGGHDRHQDFSQLAQRLTEQPVKLVLLFQPTGQRLAAAAEEALGERWQPLPDSTTPLRPDSTYFALPADMTQAIQLARQVAQAGDVVLLSPASASFGQFKDYADRSRRFVDAIKAVFTTQ